MRNSLINMCLFFFKDGTTIRGCTPHQTENDDDEPKSSIDEDYREEFGMSTRKCGAKDEECEVCSVNKCNGNIFPESRIHCLHCEGASCVNQSSTIAVRHPCVNYVQGDNCYSVFSYGTFLSAN